MPLEKMQCTMLPLIARIFFSILILLSQVGWTQPTDSLLALTHLNVLDGLGNPVKKDQTIILKGGRIHAIDDSKKTKLPPRTKEIDCSGKTAIPGLVMVHEHLYYPSPAPGQPHVNQMEFSFPRMYLAGGVTTLRTAGSVEPYSDINIKKWIESGKIPGPDIHLTAPYIEGKDAFLTQFHSVSGPEEVREMVGYWSGQGMTSFKAYNFLTRPEFEALIDEAHKRQLKVTGHLCSITYKEAAERGVDNLEHGFYVMTDFVKNKKPDQCPSFTDQRNSILELDVNSQEVTELINLLIKEKVVITSTLTVFETLSGKQPRASDEVLESLSPPAREAYQKTRDYFEKSEDQSNHELLLKTMELERKFSAAGGLLVAGTDPTGFGGVVAGYANHRQIELLVQAGFTISEAIRICTYNGAILLGLEKDRGSLENGKRADLVIVDGDMSQVQHIHRVESVYKEGKVYNSQALFKSARGRVGIH